MNQGYGGFEMAIVLYLNLGIIKTCILGVVNELLVDHWVEAAVVVLR